eukprot:scaffold138857_cov18-Prasinocladus_malaysianus.AAC.1
MAFICLAERSRATHNSKVIKLLFKLNSTGQNRRPNERPISKSTMNKWIDQPTSQPASQPTIQ